MNRYGYVFKCVDILTNKIYVGKNLGKELDKSYYGKGSIWEDVLKSRKSEHIKRTVISWCTSKKDLNEKERFWIEFYKSDDPKFGYNISNRKDVSLDYSSSLGDTSNKESRKISVECSINGNTFYFESKKSAAEWWFKYYPFSDTFSSATYVNKINDCLEGRVPMFNKIEIKVPMVWKLSEQ